MSKLDKQVKKEKVFIPVLGSNTIVCEETGEVKYLTVMVWDIEKDYTEYICK